MVDISEGIQFRRDGIDPSQWPKLSCSAANQLALEFSHLTLDSDRSLSFHGNGQLKATEDLHFFTGNPATEQLTILANGNIGIGTQTPATKLDIKGIVKADRFQGDGSTLNGVVKKAGDTIAGALTITNTLTVSGNVGIGMTAANEKLEVNGSVKAMSLLASQSGGQYSNMATFYSKNPEPPYINWLHTNSGGSPVRYGYAQAGNFGNTQEFRFVTENRANFTFLGGNMGIGTTTPQAKLDVSGDLKTNTVQFADGSIQTTAVHIVGGRVSFSQQSGVYTGKQTVQLSGFKQVPTICVALATIDADQATNLRIHAYVDNVKPNQFDICLASWADTILYSAQVTWFAFGA